MNFKPGDIVVCVDDSWQADLSKDNRYSIESAETIDAEPFVIVDQKMYRAGRFHPVPAPGEDERDMTLRLALEENRLLRFAYVKQRDRLGITYGDPMANWSLEDFDS